MITKLNSTAPAGDKGGSGGWVAAILLGAAALWAGYEFWWKPKQEAEKLAAIKAKADADRDEDKEAA